VALGPGRGGGVVTMRGEMEVVESGSGSLRSRSLARTLHHGWIDAWMDGWGGVRFSILQKAYAGTPDWAQSSYRGQVPLPTGRAVTDAPYLHRYVHLTRRGGATQLVRGRNRRRQKAHAALGGFPFRPRACGVGRSDRSDRSWPGTGQLGFGKELPAGLGWAGLAGLGWAPHGPWAPHGLAAGAGTTSWQELDG